MAERENLQPSLKDITDFNGGKKYINGEGTDTGDALNANDINNVIEGFLAVQGFAKNQPDTTEANNTGEVAVSIETLSDGTSRLKFKNLKGETGVGIVSIIPNGTDSNGGNKYLITLTDGTTAEFVAPKGAKGADGANGADGQTPTIISTVTTYQNSTLVTEIPTGAWSTTPSPKKGEYLWSKTVVTWSTGSAETIYTVAYQGLDGEGTTPTNYVTTDTAQTITGAKTFEIEANDEIVPFDITRTGCSVFKVTHQGSVARIEIDGTLNEEGLYEGDGDGDVAMYFQGNCGTEGQVLTSRGANATPIWETLLIKTSYFNLVTLKNTNKLSAGRYYRITDYKTITSQAETSYTNHTFDVIVLATSDNTLDENAYAIQHDGDTYFANSKLSAWKLKYCLENDTNRFGWASTSLGKGVIYELEDEFGNKCGYDFKNIMFKRYKITECSKCPSLVDGYYGVKQVGGSTMYPSNATINTSSTKFFYTFSVGANNEDASLRGSISGTSTRDNQGCYGNEINPYFKSGGAYKLLRYLNNIVFINGVISSFSCFNNKLTGSNIYSCTFGNNSYCNSFGGDECYGNIFGDSCHHNTLNNRCYLNTFYNSSSNSFGNYCYNNTFKNLCYTNKFGDNCHSNYFGSECYKNSFGIECNSNTFDDTCRYNTFGDNCYSNEFGSSCHHNTFGNGCNNNTIKYSCHHNTFENNCIGTTLPMYSQYLTPLVFMFMVTSELMNIYAKNNSGHELTLSLEIISSGESSPISKTISIGEEENLFPVSFAATSSVTANISYSIRNLNIYTHISFNP